MEARGNCRRAQCESRGCLGGLYASVGAIEGGARERARAIVKRAIGKERERAVAGCRAEREATGVATLDIGVACAPTTESSQAPSVLSVPGHPSKHQVKSSFIFSTIASLIRGLSL